MTIFNDFVNVLATRSCLPKQKEAGTVARSGL
jgi:hypothetical protein